MPNTATFGTYSNSQSLENALDRLAAAGFPNNTISVLFPESANCRDTTTVAEPPGWLAGAEAVAITGFGPALATGPIVSALSGSTSSSVANALIGIGLPEQDAMRYEQSMLRGNMVLLIHSDNPNSSNTARFILEDTGALEVGSCLERTGDYARLR